MSVRAIGLSVSALLAFGVHASAQNGQGANVIRNPAPPPESFAARPQSRTIFLEALIAKDGTVQSLGAVYGGVYGLDTAAMGAAKRWLARPGATSGSLMPVRVSLLLNEPAPQAPQAGGDFAKDAYPPGPGIVNPVLTKKTNPTHTPDALRANIEGQVWCEAVVEADGTVKRVRVIRSLDKTFGLDDAAVAAAKEWVFEPGTRAGQPVPVIVTLILEFRIPRSQVVFAPADAGAATLSGQMIAAQAATFGAGAYRAGQGIELPVAIRMPAAKYTADAMRALIEGVVELEAVVLANGTVGEVRVLTSLDKVHGLDNAAIAAARTFLFKPGMLNGQPVPVVVRLTIPFKL